MRPEAYRAAYQNIKAPEALRIRVMASAGARRRTRPSPWLLAPAAAAILLLLCAALFWHGGSEAYLLYFGERVDGPVPVLSNSPSHFRLYNPEEPEEIEIHLAVYAPRAVTVSVSGGQIAPEGGEREKTLRIRSEKTLSLTWYAEASKTPLTLTLRDGRGKVTYTLTRSQGEMILQQDK